MMFESAEQNLEKDQSHQKIYQKILEQIQNSKTENDDENLQKKHENLRFSPVLDSNFLTDTTAGIEKTPSLKLVKVEQIVGRPFASRFHNGWGFEYDDRKGRIIKIAKSLLNLGQDQTKKEEILENIFHLNRPVSRIQLDEIEGPHGPIYSVRDGTHRIAGIMVAGLETIPCDVYKIRYPLENITDKEDIAKIWTSKIELGLIQGEVKILDEGGKYKLIVEKEVLPWIRTQSQYQLSQISLIYERLYPNSLNDLKIPRDALVNPIANKYFMAKKWEEWEKEYASEP